MKSWIAAAFALTPMALAHAQTPASRSADFTTAMPLPGSWNYAPTSDGSQATFVDRSARTQLTIHCTRATRRVSIGKPATGAAPFLFVWTSTQSRNALASFNPATARLTADLAAFDPLLDAIAFSRGRVAFSVTGTPALVVPAWSEIARVVEDCRA
jgi:hypothetical protein